jgi:hypothetical protein
MVCVSLRAREREREEGISGVIKTRDTRADQTSLSRSATPTTRTSGAP